MSSAKASAERVLDELGINDPQLLKHLVEICIERGAYVRQANLTGADARLTVRGSSGIITVKSQPRYKTRTRFSIAHELGHFEMHRKQNLLLTCEQKDLFEGAATEKIRTREGEANDFASELLMPERFIRPLIIYSEPSIDVLQDLSRQFETSLFATAKRFIQLTPRECIAVFYDRERIRYVWTSPQLADVTLPWIRKLRPESKAWASIHRKSGSSLSESVDPVAWFNLHPSQSNDAGKWSECARFFPALNLGISLLEKGSEK